MTHKTVDYRHQVVCLRCSCVGHMASCCPVEPKRSPRRRVTHVRSKHSQPPRVRVPELPGIIAKVEEQPHQREAKVNRISLSVSLSPESEELREDLAKVAVLSLEDGYVNDTTLRAIIPSLINKELVGPITPLNGAHYLLPMESREGVKELCKLGSFTAATKDGPCRLKIALWSAELGAEGRASGDGQ